MEIQWYPGHMAKTAKILKNNIKKIDIVLELADARIPESSRNPDLEELIRNKDRILVLTKTDLANEGTTQKWLEWYKKKNIVAIPVVSTTSKGINNLLEAINNKKNKITDNNYRKIIKAIVVGIPNIGKSTLINQLARTSKAKTGSKPGVTRGTQWITINRFIRLLDTPGILWPKIEDKKRAIKLAFIGSIKDEILDIQALAIELLKYLQENDKNRLIERFKLDCIPENYYELLESIGRARGCLQQGNRVDILRTAGIVLEEFRKGKLGKVSLETPEEFDS